MNFSQEAIPAVVQWLAHAAFALILIQSLRHAPWDYLKDRDDHNILFASTLLLWLIRQLRTDIPGTEGLEFHLLMATSVTLMFGWAFAFLIICASEILITFQGIAEWNSYTTNLLCNGGIPIAITLLVYKVVRRYLPRHFFIYIFVCCFLAGALSMLASRLASMTILLAGQTHTVFQLHANGYFTMIPITLFPEGFVNGAIMTMLVVFKPHWVGSFRDQHYLRGK